MTDPIPTPPAASTPPIPTPINPRKRSFGLYLAGVVLLGAAAAATLYYMKAGAEGLSASRAALEAEAARGPRVVVGTVTKGPEYRTITLLGDARPFTTATLFAQVSGYVKAVQVVAEIESAELECQYQSAVADLDYKQRLAVRARELLRTGSTLDPRTRTLFIQIDVDNRDNFLVPGSFTYAILKVPVPSFPQIPVAALNQRGGVQQVAVVGEDAIVKFRPVRIPSTDGVLINIADGVKPGEKVALNVPNEVSDGTKVRPTAGR